ncbi:hypothetical protein ES705_19451 [subsurface metagenome]
MFKLYLYIFVWIPKKDQKRIEFDLTHMNKQDVLRQGRFKGELNYFRKMNNGDFRILLAYCAECYDNFRSKINCAICDDENLERIIVFFIHPRKKLYQPRKFQHVDITKICKDQ